MSAACIFCKIAAGEIPADVVWEDDQALAFRDISPQAPKHLLIIPRRHLERLADSQPEDQQLLGHLLSVASRLASQEGVSDGYRVVVNNGASAGQSVFHLHLHVLGGRTFGWPPG